MEFTKYAKEVNESFRQENNMILFICSKVCLELKFSWQTSITTCVSTCIEIQNDELEYSDSIPTCYNICKLFDCIYVICRKEIMITFGVA